MGRESTIHMMIFSMNITCYRATHCYEFGTWSNGKEPAFRNNDFQYLVQCQPGLAFKNSFFGIERENLIVFKCRQGIFFQRGISITTSVSPCYHIA